MAIKRYVANADNTIVNAYETNLKTRATGANAGAADVLEVYSIYGRQSSASQELSRVLIKFPVSRISSDRTAGTIPASGNVSFYLQMYNAETSKTVPRDYTLNVRPIAQDWQEGVGLDLELYKDKTKGNPGSNWLSASNTTPWTGSTYSSSSANVGGSYRTGSGDPHFKKTFSTGLEDLKIDITPLVEHWIAGTISNYGVGVHLTSSQEASGSAQGNTNDQAVIPLTGGANKSYYTKRFFARGTQYYFKKPIIEARWDSTKRDQRGNFYFSSSLAPAADNMNTIYLYNYIRGKLTNIPNLGEQNRVYVSIFSGSSDNSAPSGAALILSPDNTGYVRSADKTVVTGGYVSTGIYSASFAFTGSTSLKTLYDVWFTGSSRHHDHSTSTQYSTGTIKPYTHYATQQSREPTYYINITNLKSVYSATETARFNLYVREKNWSPTIYSVANADPPVVSITSASYRVYRIVDSLEAIPHGTGSDYQTGLSYDVSGNYFDLSMNLLEPGYAYGLKFAFYDSEMDTWTEQRESFKFRVEDYEY
jgi:hypothetical protein